MLCTWYSRVGLGCQRLGLGILLGLGRTVMWQLMRTVGLGGGCLEIFFMIIYFFRLPSTSLPHAGQVCAHLGGIPLHVTGI